MNSLPLFSSALEAYKNQQKLPDTAHAGLWFDKFVNTWRAGKWEEGLKAYTVWERGKPVEHDPKKKWLQSLCAIPLGNKNVLSQMAERQKRMVESLGGISCTVMTTSPFVTGMGRSHPLENGFTFHPTLGVAYLPGSGLKGAARSWATQWANGFDKNSIARIFGPKGTEDNSVGSVIFFDMIPIAPVRMKMEIMTPHYKEYYEECASPGDWLSPTPIPFLAVESGQFQLALCPRKNYHAEDFQRVVENREDMLAFMGCGAKNSSGLGRFTIVDNKEPTLK